jgi:hypothetical protein
MLKKLIINFSLPFFFIMTINPDSIFNSVFWKKDYEVNNIILYSNPDKDHKLNYYKAETELDNAVGDKFYNNLIDFDKYQKIFSKIFFIKKIDPGDGDKDSGIYYSLLNFSPLKNRGYYVNLKYYTEDNSETKRYVVEWSPVTDFKKNFEVDPDCLFVKLVYGRWQIIENEGKIKISVEYYNDFQVPGPKAIIYNVEKSVTVNALKELIKYTLAEK